MLYCMHSSDRVWRVQLPDRKAIDVVVRADEHAPLLSGALERHAHGDLVVVADPRPLRRDRRPGIDGRLIALRQGLPASGEAERLTITSVLPESPEAADRFPLGVTATSAITAGVAAFFFSPVFALLAGVSTLAAVGRWVASKVSVARAGRRRVAAVAAARLDWIQLRDTWVDGERERQQRQHHRPVDLRSLIAGRGSPWSRRLDRGDAIDFVVGTGSIEVSAPVSGPTTPADLGVSPEVRLEAVPIVVPCAVHRGLAVCGDRSQAIAAVRWLALSALTSIGPADLEVCLVTTADRCCDWDWLKWVPSLTACVVGDLDGDELLVRSLEGEAVKLIIVDGAEPTGAGCLARLLSGRVENTRLLWLGAAGDVPAGCSSRLEVAADQHGRWVGEDRTQSLSWYGIDVDEAERTSRWLAAFDDPEVEPRFARLPASVLLSELASPHRSGTGRTGTTPAAPAAVEARWTRATSRTLKVMLGVHEDGVVEIDLVADGPHALVAGTTGSGKSELLRTLVVGMAMEQPPDLVSFVLIDFKGGGAFDAVDSLPHVAAVVTDLDPAEASRALRGLRAEVLDRERRLRDMEVNDVGATDRSHPRAFGRLVVIIDEFAALADELPDFLDGLVDIARRGRSLGVHLVLATQRPAGVVTGQIRANTNLRICLRVQDRSDSIDVLGQPDAAHLPSIPGRAILRRGGEACEPLQVARIHGQVEPVVVEPFVIHPSVTIADEDRRSIVELEQLLAARGGGETNGEGRADVDRHSVVARDAPAPRDSSALRDSSMVEMVEMVEMVASVLGFEQATAPWRPVLSAVAFPVRGFEDSVRMPVGPGSPDAVLGLLDDPDRRCVTPLCWNPDVDGLLVVGVEGRTIAATAAVAVCSVLDRPGRRPVPVFVLDGGPDLGGLLQDLTGPGPVVDVVRISEPDRLARAVEQLLVLSGPLLVVIHDWQAVADAVGDRAGPAAVEGLVRLVRRGGSAGVSIIVTARSDRDVPQRAAAHLGQRVIHRLADPAGYVSFGLRVSELPSVDGSRCVDVASGLLGVVASLADEQRNELAGRLARSDTDPAWPSPIRVLGPRVERADLPPVEVAGDGWRVPLGLDADLDPHWIMVSPLRPVVVVAHPGGGRTTTLETIGEALGDRVCLIDDVDTLEDADVADQIADARKHGRLLAVSCGPGSARRFGSAIAAVMSSATVVLVNPGRSEGEVVRVPIPDLADQPVGRAVAVERGRATVVQIAV